MSKYTGEINLILGCMFSGKTSELIKIVRRYRSIKKNVMVLNYCKDTRYSNEEIMTHDLIGEKAFMINNFDDIENNEEYKKIYYNSDIICINEGQFFKGLVKFCNLSANEHNKKIYVCGLDGDFKQEKFGEILDLIPCSENITRLSALCNICGKKACFTKRVSKSNDQILIGGKENYIPVCRLHYYSFKKESEYLDENYGNYTL
mgnify:CR=1 FL=1